MPSRQWINMKKPSVCGVVQMCAQGHKATWVQMGCEDGRGGAQCSHGKVMPSRGARPSPLSAAGEWLARSLA